MTSKTETRNQDSLQRLVFRRQFLLGPKPFAPTQYWSSIQLLDGLSLSIHDDLSFVSESRDDVTATLIGIAIDPHNPQHGESDILHSLITKASDIKTLIDATAPLAGRWVVIFQNPTDTYLFTDPCGFRQVFYYSDGQQFWCGSQPEIIKGKHQMPLAADQDVMDFLVKPEFARRASAWIGAKTLYEGCSHLMPNHYLSVSRREAIRFYPSRPMPIKNLRDVVETSTSILQAVMAALTGRYNVCLALTAGWDSRLLLAASRDVCEQIEYFVYRTGFRSETNPDVWVPKRLAKKLNINFIVRTPADELPGWFVSMLSQNVTNARVQANTRNIYGKFVTGERRININGNASEICRNFFDKYCKLDPREICPADLAQMVGYGGVTFVVKELDIWRRSLNCERLEGLNILDMLYWEQRLGNWGAQYPAEQDIAVEEVSPFNCRLLIENLSATPRRLRAAPDYPLYRELIRYLWPEVLSVPINPTQKGDVISFAWSRVEPYIPFPVVQKLKAWLK
jgi:hypothetical protein